MSLLKAGERAPDWSEVEAFEVIELAGLETRTFPRQGEKEIYLTARGHPVYTCGGHQSKATVGGYFSVPDDRADETSIWAWHGPALIVRITGHWERIATAGVHVIQTTDKPRSDGAPYIDKKNTDLDRHYHDNQECWVFFEGNATCVVGDEFIDVKCGDGLLTPRGWHQDVLTIEGGGDLSLVWLGCTPRGQKRIGHLCEAENGVAQPEMPLPVPAQSH